MAEIYEGTEKGGTSLDYTDREIKKERIEKATVRTKASGQGMVIGNDNLTAAHCGSKRPDGIVNQEVLTHPRRQKFL